MAGSNDTLVWSDEFNSGVLDTNVWTPQHNSFGDGNKELHCYTPANVSVENGALKLTTKIETYSCPTGGVRDYTSGMVRSQGVTFEPGQRVEFRVRQNARDPEVMSGLFPAVWASSWNGGSWPTGGETDFYEGINRAENDKSFVNTAVHFEHEDTGKHRHIGKNFEPEDPTAWAVVTFEWGQELLTWTYNGEVTQELRAEDIPAANNPFFEPNSPITQLRVNQAVGGDWVGDPADGAIDAEGNSSFEMDWIRIYDLAD